MFCPFRLSSDEMSLIWYSSSGERSLKLASVSNLIPGQRTAVFKIYLRPDKDYLSFSLIYNNGKRSLDLICKDKVEAEDPQKLTDGEMEVLTLRKIKT